MDHQIDVALRASRRTAAVVDRRMRRGLTSLATIASIAPWIGFLATVEMIIGSFRGAGGEAEAAKFWCVGNLSYAIVPSALGIAIAITAMWFYKYLNRAVATIDTEMEAASLALANSLALHPGRR